MLLKGIAWIATIAAIIIALMLAIAAFAVSSWFYLASLAVIAFAVATNPIARQKFSILGPRKNAVLASIGAIILGVTALVLGAHQVAQAPAAETPESLANSHTQVEIFQRILANPKDKVAADALDILAARAEKAKSEHLAQVAEESGKSWKNTCMLAEATGGKADAVPCEFEEGTKYMDRKNFTKSLYYFEKACSDGEPNGCRNAAVQYENGQGVGADKVRAIEFLDKYLSLVNDDPEVKKWVNDLKRETGH